MPIDDFVNQVEKDAKDLERDLYDEIMAVVIGLMTINGKTVFNEKNILIVGKLDKAFASFDKNFQQPFIKKISVHLKGLDKFYVDYFNEMGLDARSFKGFNALMKSMDDYLNSVSVLNPVKMEVKNYILSSISQGKGIGTIRMGLRSILGLKERSSVLNRYYRTFLYDTIMKFDRMVSNAHAKQNNLKYFEYAGGLIETSREFCIKRNGLVFDKNRIADWILDPSLPETPGYVPIVDMGSYNCRHYPLFLTDEQAKEKLNEKG